MATTYRIVLDNGTDVLVDTDPRFREMNPEGWPFTTVIDKGRVTHHIAANHIVEVIEVNQLD